MALVTINGRRRYFNRVSAVRLTAPGRYEVTTEHHGTFTVEGGRKAGGSRRDWFLESASWNRPIQCSSLMDAVRVIETM
jgi:hypothetical protein